jgi:ribosomal protein S12 methylthiotransferase
MAEGKILPYLDVPFQHASPRILKLMKRPACREGARTHCRLAREVPDMAIRSTFIAGFPGETEAEFEELLDFLDEAQLDRVGAFAYSPVEGATANATCRARCRSRCAKSARQRLMRQFQEDISTQRLEEPDRSPKSSCWLMRVDEDGATARSRGRCTGHRRSRACPRRPRPGGRRFRRVRSSTAMCMISMPNW